jgi:hypothetical protein
MSEIKKPKELRAEAREHRSKADDARKRHGHYEAELHDKIAADLEKKAKR